MTNNGAPRLTAEDKGYGRTVYRPENVLAPSSPDVSAEIPQAFLATPEEPIAPIAPPVRRSVADAQAMQPQPPASDGYTASMPPIIPEPQPPFEPAFVVDPPAGRAPVVPAALAVPDTPDTPTAQTAEVTDKKENTVSKHKLTFQHIVPHMGALAGIAAMALLVGLFQLPVLGAVLLLAIAPALVLLVAFVRRAKVTVSDKVKGNSLGPIIATAAITATLVLLVTNPVVIGTVLTSDVFWAMFIVIALAATLFMLQGANIDKTDDSKEE